MTTYKEQIFQFLQVAKSERFDVFKDEDDEIYILTKELEMFEQEVQGILEGLTLADDEFGGKHAGIEITISNGQAFEKLVKNSDSEWAILGRVR